MGNPERRLRSLSVGPKADNDNGNLGGEMALGEIQIKGLRGGGIAEITSFLTDMEGAYNSLYIFERHLTLSENSRIFVLGLHNTFLGNFANEVPPQDRLEISKISIQSPGFWEFLGQLNPLQQIREYLNERHERRKDREYRELSEKEKLTLDNELLQRQILEKDTAILRDHLIMLKEFGFDENSIRDLIWEKLGPQFSKLGRHQDRGLIEGSLGRARSAVTRQPS